MAVDQSPMPSETAAPYSQNLEQAEQAEQASQKTEEESSPHLTTGNVIGGIILFSLAKKIAVIALARIYGFPRIYRKALRLSKNIENERFQQGLRVGLKRTLRLPNSFVAYFWRNRRQQVVEPS